MSLLNHWMQSDIIKALGWTFVHSLWQIAIIGLLLFIILRLIPGRSAHVRYTISTLAIWMIVITTLSTFIIMLPNEKPVTEFSGSIILIQDNTPLSLSARISLWLEMRMPMMLTVWLGGVIILMLRLLLSLGWVRHLRSTGKHMDDIQMILDDIIHRLQLKIRPGISESGHISSPLTIGHLKPLILFPIGLINQLSPAEVEAIITHELAHIVRRDYLSNLIQSFIETLFYYHPVTWWISNVVRTERENRADDLAITWCGDQLGYAKALMSVQEMEVHPIPSLAIGFASHKGAMLARIKRILHIPYKHHNQMEKTVLLSLCSLCFLAFTLTSHTEEAMAKDKSALTTDILTLIEESSADTIPSKGTYRIHKKTDDQDISIEVEDGDIKELHIDGKEIKPEAFSEYNAIIEDLFGGIDAAPTMGGFMFVTPPSSTHMPGMPPMSPMAPMPPMPDMSRMAEIELEQYFGGHPNIQMWSEEDMDHYEFFYDSLGSTNRKMTIYHDGDSTIIMVPGEGWNIALDGLMAKEHGKEWKKKWEEYGEHWKEQTEHWKEHGEQWKEQAEQWREHKQIWKEQMREYDQEIREQQQQLREELRGHSDPDEDIQRDIDRELKMMGDLKAELRMMIPTEPFTYEHRAPRLSLTDQLVRDGLIDDDEEVEVLLTSDKLKIDGKKMDDETHQKYLRMYEAQQGVEISGNSRIQFKTKSRGSM